MTYNQLLQKMPGDHLSNKWVEWFIQENNKNGSLLISNDAFLLARNWKFINGELDPKYSRKYEDALVLFPKSNVMNAMELPGDLRDRLWIFVDEMHKRNYYTYYNSPADMTIKRLHIHFLAWNEHKDINILFDI